MLLRAEINTLVEREPRFDDIACSLNATAKFPAGISREARELMAIARKFNDEVARPYALELDRLKHADPDYLPWDFVKKANEWGFYTMFIPKLMGGGGYAMSGCGYFIEELCSVCAALSNLILVHYLGFIGLSTAFNGRLTNRICRDVVEGQKSGKPCLLSFAMTEPTAGTDSQNIEFMDAGTLGTFARKVEDGYVINGSKVFISCGHLSTWHILYAYTDLARAAENMVVLAVKTGAKGFSFGRMEKKMGQKGCPASELVFKDCFIPDENVLLDNRQTVGFESPPRKINMQILAYIWSMSRVGVGAMGTGVARGAFEEALRFASETEIDGAPLINQEWCQVRLAEMYQNVSLARLACNESSYVNALYSAMKMFAVKPVYYFIKLMPKKLGDFLARLMESPLVTRLLRKGLFDKQDMLELDRTDGWASMAKVAGSDAAVKNCQMALEIMGRAGIRHDGRAEKMLRDSKLIQIYEGTNQINRINVFKRLIARNCSGTECFSGENR